MKCVYRVFVGRHVTCVVWYIRVVMCTRRLCIRSIQCAMYDKFGRQAPAPDGLYAVNVVAAAAVVVFGGGGSAAPAAPSSVVACI